MYSGIRSKTYKMVFLLAPLLPLPLPLQASIFIGSDKRRSGHNSQREAEKKRSLNLNKEIEFGHISSGLTNNK